MKQYRICIISQSHLCRNPRVLKEAVLLAQNGYKVTVINAGFSKQLSDEDNELIKPYDIKLLSAVELQKGGISTALIRFASKLSRRLIKWANIQTAPALGYYSSRYKKLALLQSADLYIGHQGLGLYFGVELAKAGKKVAFDIEDWYSEDFQAGETAHQPISLLRQLEQYALQKGTFCVTTSKVMAKQLADAYQASKPASIYNVFDEDLSIYDKPKQFDRPLKILWFSQTIGKGRGLEEFIALMDGLDTAVELHLLGAISADYRYQLESNFPKEHQLFFHELVKTNMLHEKIKAFDIGLAIEQHTPLSRNYTITNKFFQYLQAGLPVIATPTAGQAEAFEKYQPGILINLLAGPEDVAQLNTWLNNKQTLLKAAQAAQQAAKEYNWQNESKKLLSLVQKALNE